MSEDGKGQSDEFMAWARKEIARLAKTARPFSVDTLRERASHAPEGAMRNRPHAAWGAAFTTASRAGVIERTGRGYTRGGGWIPYWIGTGKVERDSPEELAALVANLWTLYARVPIPPRYRRKLDEETLRMTLRRAAQVAGRVERERG